MLVLLMLGCGLGDVVVDIEAPACTDWDFNNGEDRDPEMVVEYSETEISVVRNGVFMDCNARFTPEIVAEGGLVVIDEYWEGEEGACCFAPQVLLTTERAGSIEIQWYDPQGESVYNEEIDTSE